MNAMCKRKLSTSMLFCVLSCKSLGAISNLLHHPHRAPLPPVINNIPLLHSLRYVRLLNGRLRLEGGAAADDDIPDPIRRAPLLGPIF